MGGRTRRSPVSGNDVGGMLDGISAVLGRLVVLTPFLFIETGNYPAMLSATGCGLAVMGLAFLDRLEPQPWTRWGSGVLGAWVAVSPWFLQRALVPPDLVLASPMADPRSRCRSSSVSPSWWPPGSTSSERPWNPDTHFFRAKAIPSPRVPPW
ncbi:SPW repeat domain-containing protein [Methylobacterium sp.]|uniref:SPW repeat domain-containing protein n=2 Tax=Methylobacterium sp. TaxID=409 RepID=UPI003B5B253D